MKFYCDLLLLFKHLLVLRHRVLVRVGLVVVLWDWNIIGVCWDPKLRWWNVLIRYVAMLGMWKV